MELCLGAKVTPLRARPGEPPLLLAGLFLMMPEHKQHLCVSVSSRAVGSVGVLLLCWPPTCRGQHIQPLQAVLSRRVVCCLGAAALALVQHGSRGDDARGRDFPHPPVQIFNLLFLIGLQVLHLRQVSDMREDVGFELLDCFDMVK